MSILIPKTALATTIGKISIEDLGGSAFSAPASVTGGNFGTTSINIDSDVPDYHLVHIQYNTPKPAYQNQGLKPVDVWLLFTSNSSQTWRDFITIDASDEWVWLSKNPSSGFTYSMPSIAYRDYSYLGNFQSSAGNSMELKCPFYSNNNLNVFYTTNHSFWADLGVTVYEPSGNNVFVNNLMGIVSRMNQQLENQADQLSELVSARQSIDTLSTRALNIYNRLQSYFSSDGQLQTEIIQRIGSINTNVQSIKNNSDLMAGDISDISDNTSSIASDTSSIASDTSTISGTVSNMDSSLSSIDSGVADVNSALGGISDALASMDSALGDIFGKLPEFGASQYGNGSGLSNGANETILTGSPAYRRMTLREPINQINIFTDLAGQLKDKQADDDRSPCYLSLTIPFWTPDGTTNLLISTYDNYGGAFKNGGIMRSASFPYGFSGSGVGSGNYYFGAVIKYANSCVIAFILFAMTLKLLMRVLRSF